jgi:SAM-dependent methyltransferase
MIDAHAFSDARTAAFVTEALGGRRGLRVLEVGAGRGRLAKRLREQGLTVDAIDRSADAVAAASALGNAVTHADLTEYRSDTRYDAIVFCMSAHHVAPLDRGLDRARELLRTGGRLILEEYAVERADEPTARWYEQTRSLAAGIGVYDPAQADTVLDNLRDPLGSWRRDHTTNADHHFNSGAELLAAVESRFHGVTVARGPYFFRYLTPRLAERCPDPRLAERLFALEERLITAGQIQPLGLRVVASAR